MTEPIGRPQQADPALPAPGWYPDPVPGAQPGTMRYWDGRAWTAGTRQPAPQPLDIDSELVAVASRITPRESVALDTPSDYYEELIPTSDKSFWGTFALATFLGAFGADRLYLGRWVSAIIKFLFVAGMALISWWFLSEGYRLNHQVSLRLAALWPLADILLIAFDTTKSKDGLELRGGRRGLAVLVALALALAWGYWVVQLLI